MKRVFQPLRHLIGSRGIKVLALIIIFVGMYFLVNITGAFFWTVFFTFLFFRIDSKYVGQAALLLLILLPLLLALGKQDVAEQLAVYAFFLLTITVALQIVELKLGGGETNKLEFIDRPVQQISRRVSNVIDLRNRGKVLDLRNHPNAQRPEPRGKI